MGFKTPLEKVQIARTRMVMESRFWGALAMKLKLRVSPDGFLPGNAPAAVDGVHIYFSGPAVMAMPMDKLIGLIAHEVAHCVAKHHLRREHREPERFNVACDFAINPMLVKSTFDLPDGGLNLDGKQFEDGKGFWLSAEEIYSKLPPGTGKQSQQGMAGAGAGGAGVPGMPGPGDYPTGVVIDYPGEDGDPTQGKTTTTAGEREAADRDWSQAVASAAAAAQAAGDLPGHLKHLADAIMHRKVRWQDVLAPWVQQTADDYSWMPPNRRILAMVGVMVPSLHSQGIKHLALGLDTSGSVPEEVIREMLGEMQAILDIWPSAKLTVYSHHVGVYRVDEYSADNPPHMVEYQSGGTDFRPVFEKIAEEQEPPDCLVMLTDLYGEAPATPPAYPVLWVSNGAETAPFGDIVMVEP